MLKAVDNVTILGEPLRDRLRMALKRHKVNQTKFAAMFNVGKMQASSWLTGKRQIPAKYWPLIERWIATGEAPDPEDVKLLRLPNGAASRPITLEELERLGAVCTMSEAAGYFGYRVHTFVGLINDNRDFREAFNKASKEKLPIVQVQNLASIGSTLEDIAIVFDLTLDQVQRVFATWNEYQQAFDKGRAEMRVSIRRRQFEIMMLTDKYNIKSALTAAIWLGKNELGQNDKPKEQAEEKPTETIIRWATETEAKDFEDGNLFGGAAVNE